MGAGGYRHLGVLSLVQVRGLEAIKQFSENLMHPYQPSGDGKNSRVEDLETENTRLRSQVSIVEELEAENARLQSRVKELEGQQTGHCE